MWAQMRCQPILGGTEIGLTSLSALTGPREAQGAGADPEQVGGGHSHHVAAAESSGPTREPKMQGTRQVPGNAGTSGRMNGVCILGMAVLVEGVRRLA